MAPPIGFPSKRSYAATARTVATVEGRRTPYGSRPRPSYPSSDGVRWAYGRAVGDIAKGAIGPVKLHDGPLGAETETAADPVDALARYGDVGADKPCDLVDYGRGWVIIQSECA